MLEIVLRIQQDDPISISRIDRFLSLAPSGTMKVIVGQKHGGYAGLQAYYEEIAALCVGTHVWVMNDDVTVFGFGWDLEVVPGNREILIPFTHKLGLSTYHGDTQCPFMIVPNKSWEELGDDHFGSPFDLWLWSGLRRVGYSDRFVANLGIHHDRRDDSKMNDYRSVSTEDYVSAYNSGLITKELQ
jgi:hypothetical protein